jgi:pimeloyl-ACP methyl ester carboxylesterase
MHIEARRPDMGIYRTAAGGATVRRRYAEVLDAWPVPAQRLTVPTREGDTFVLACGPADAPAVVAFQGSGANVAMWLPQIRAFAGHLRVYAVDVIGEPGLSAPARPPLGTDAYAGWLDDVLDGLGVPRAALLGVSLGGWLALDYALRRPEQVSRLALVAPSGIGRRRGGMLAVAALLGLLGDRGRRRALGLALGPAARTAPPPAALGDLSVLIFRHFRPRMAVPTFDDGALRRLAVATRVVVGARDAMLDSAGTAHRLADLVPHAEVVVDPTAGHLVPGQEAGLLTFLRGAPAPTGGRP